MALYINCYYGEGEDDATLQGAEWLSKFIAHQQGPDAAEAFFARFRELHGQENQSDYGPVFDLFLDHSAELFAAIPESKAEERVKEVESFYALVMNLLLYMEEESDIDTATTRLCDLFSNNVEQYPDLRLRLIMMLYNTFLPTFPLRYRVFKYILDYAAKANVFDQVLPYLEHLEAWMADWDLSLDDKRILYRDIAKYTRAYGKRVDAFLYLKRYHLLFQGEPAEVLSEKDVQQSTIDLLTDAIQMPSVIQFDDILNFDTVKALQKTKQESLVKICGLFLSGSVNDLRDFHKKNGKVFEEHGLNINEAMSKVRLLTLATLAMGKSEIALSEVAEALEEPEDSVEQWVVRAISEGVLDGRIDQLNHKVLVKSAFQRKFEKEEWAFLDSKLTQWIDNLENVVKFIGDQKVLRAKVGTN
jgi:translation initiation factor 3 subunit M